jgi:hypothetical protein
VCVCVYTIQFDFMVADFMVADVMHIFIPHTIWRREILSEYVSFVSVLLLIINSISENK